MSTSVSKPRKPRGPGREVIGFDDYIDRQLAKVRTYVRLSDLAVAVVTCATLVGVLLFLAVLVDHWIVDLGRLGRFAVLSATLIILAYALMTQIVPLLAKRMNPAYVANIIEQSEPSLKNSLLNFVFFRTHPVGVRKIVLEAVERQAAADLSRVDVDATIDRTPLIRMGMALGALLFAFVLYAFLSPKDPLASVARVMLPWHDRARPSRVEILNVQPGSTSIYSGRHLDVSATVHRLRDDEQPSVLYSTMDGQVIDAKLDLRQTEPASADQDSSIRDGRWSITLPASSDGLHQDITYRIVAGDAVAGPFRVKVIPAPSIVVEQIEYTYPDYMQRAPVVVDDRGEINTVEGTRVTVRANANQQIEYAYIEFDADQFDAANGTSRHTLTMKHDGRDAWATFTARLKPDRSTPWHSNYQVRFRNLDKATNDRPAHYGIQVTPDIAPVVEILTPTMQDIDLPVDATQTIEIRALDPDYGLDRVALKANVRDSDRSFEHELLAKSRDEKPITGQRVVKFPFQPNKLGLRPGDVVDYQALAADNRIDPGTGTPVPNITTTTAYQFRILPAKTNAADTGQNGAGPDQQNTDQQDPSAQPSDNANQAPDQADEKTDQDRQPEEGQSNEGQSNEGQSNEGQSNEGQSNEGQSNEGQSNEGQSNEGQSNEGQSNEGQSNEGQSNDDNGSKPGAKSGEQDPNNANQEQPPGTEKENGSPENGGQENGGQENGDQENGHQENDDRDRQGQPNQGTGDQKDDSGGSESGNEQPADGDTGDASDPAANPRDRQRPTKGTGSEKEPSDDASATSADDSESFHEDQPKNGESAAESQPGDTGNQNGESANADEAADDQTSTDDQQPLPSDGSRDGDAIERMLKRIRERTGKKPETNRREKQPCPNCNDGSCESCQQGQSEPADSGSSQPSTGGTPDRKRQPESNNRRPGTERDAGSDSADRSSTDQPNPGGQPQDQSAPGQQDRPADQPDARQPEPGQEDNQQPRPGDRPSGDEPGQPQDGSTDGQTPEQGPGAQAPNAPATDAQPGEGQTPGDAVPSSDTQSNPPSDQSKGQPGGAQSPLSEGSADPRGSATPAVAEDGGEPTDADSDEVNLDYAREATDLVLDYLKNQQNQGDRELLDRLGWTPEQLADFQRRWSKMKRDAERNDPVGVSARRELDDVLRSLGLAPEADRLQVASDRDDEVQVGNTGRRSRPPAAYRQRYQRFLKSLQGSQ